MVPIYEYTWKRRKVAEAPGPVTTPQDAVNLIRSVLDGDGLEKENLVVIALNTKNRPIASETVYVGNVAGSSVRVGEVFRLAVRMNAASIIIGHNHPSGDPAPSAEDTHITEEFVKAGRLLDIEALDHVIVGDSGRWVSMRALGLMTPGGS